MITSAVEVRPLPWQLVPIVFIVVMLGVVAYFVPADVNLPMWIRVIAPVICTIGIVGTLGLWFRSRRRRIVVDSVGITRYGLFRNEQIAWTDITRYRYLSLKQPAVAHGRGGAGLLGLVTGALEEGAAQNREAPNRYFGLGHVELHSRTSTTPFRIGKHPFFGPRAGYVELSDVIEIILDEVDQRLGPSEVAFAPFTLREKTLQHENGTSIDLSAISSVSVRDGSIRISNRASGEWARAAMKTTDNSMLLLRRLAENGVSIVITPEVFVPQSTLHALSR